MIEVGYSYGENSSERECGGSRGFRMQNNKKKDKGNNGKRELYKRQRGIVSERADRLEKSKVVK